jgi:polysaccharide export outer membrane protein
MVIFVVVATLATMAQTQLPQIANMPSLPAGASVHASGGQAMSSGGVFPIGVGDLLDVAVFDTPEMSGQLRVDLNGNVTMPLVGSIHVVGLRTDDAQKLIQQRLISADLVKEPQVAVFIREYATQGVSVWGEVKSPGVYPVLGNRRISDVLSMAGGTTPAAAPWATVTRREDAIHPLRVDLKTLSADNGSGMELHPGDTVQVERAGLVYVVGDVVKPGGFIMDSGKISVLQALAMAQGANRTAKLGSARIVRNSASGATETPVELQKVVSAKAADVDLQPGDILFVPSSAAKSAAAKGIQGILQAAVGVAIYAGR